MTMTRVLQLRRSLLSLSKPYQFQAPIVSLIPSLVGDHGRYNTLVSNILQDHTTNKNSPYGFRTFYIGTDRLYSEFVSCNARNRCRILTEEEANDLIREVDGWKVLNEDGELKLGRSWRVKSHSKGSDLFKLVSDVHDAEGRSSCFRYMFKGHNLVGWNTVTIEIWTEAVDGLTENDFKLALKFNKLDLQHLLSRTDLFLDQLKRKAATISA